jgi:hypothetical protein
VFFLSNEDPLPAELSGLRLQIVAQFFDVRTDGRPGLGPTYLNIDGLQTPIANVRIGFAFHQDPSQALAQGNDPLRFPPLVGSFLYDGDSAGGPPLDLSDPAVQDQIQGLHSQFIQWDIQFNTRFSETEPGNTRAASNLSPASPRPEVLFLVIPYRF